MPEGSNAGFIAVYDAFRATEFGQAMADQVRYGKYQPADVSDERWVQLLGADVNNLTHMRLTYGLTKAFLGHAEPGQFDAEEQATLQVAALMHDSAEAITGDISYGDKTVADEAEEQAALAGHVDRFFAGISDRHRRLVATALETVIFDPTTKLGRAFNAIERAGYVRTALLASNHLERGTAPDCPEALRWIVGDVLFRQTEKLIEYAGDYWPVREYLVNQRQGITVAFGQVTEGVFENYPAEQRAVNLSAFCDAQRSWLLWIVGAARESSGDLLHQLQ